MSEAPPVPLAVMRQKISTAPLRPDRILMSESTWNEIVALEAELREQDDRDGLEAWLQRWGPFNSTGFGSTS